MPCRLLTIRVPEEVAAERRRRIRYIAKRKHKNPNKFSDLHFNTIRHFPSSIRTSKKAGNIEKIFFILLAFLYIKTSDSSEYLLNTHGCKIHREVVFLSAHNTSAVSYLSCTFCSREFSPEQVMYTCPHCRPKATLDVHYDLSRVRNQFGREYLHRTTEQSIWRYKPILPVNESTNVPRLRVGWTPLYPALNLCREFGLSNLWVKDDTGNPTASFKDRASAVAVMKAQEFGFDTIACASTGNAASSLSGIAASVGLRCVIFVPAYAPKAKLAQILSYGADLVPIDGSYDAAFDLCFQACQEFHWYCRNTAINPYLGEGKKTAALEICEQLDWQVPDKVFVPVGDGCIIGGIWKGFKDFFDLGLIERLPQLIGVQAEGSKALVDAFQSGETYPTEVVPDTIADSIAVGIPRDAIKALRAVRESGGQMIAVSDEEIIAAIGLLARKQGIFAEPAGAAALAGLHKFIQQNLIDANERIVVLVTGSGLKDVDAVLGSISVPKPVRADIESVKAIINKKLRRRIDD